jgi:type II restriction enzyme
MHMKLTPSNLLSFIQVLPRNVQYPYVNPRTRSVVMIESVTAPEGPIAIRRFNPAKGESPRNASIETISSEMLWRVANAVQTNTPFNLDRILGASYNTRSALETLIAHTPQFYFCYTGRIEQIQGHETIKRGHKHLIWCPDSPHAPGIVREMKTDMVISEIPHSEVIYDAIAITDTSPQPLDIDTRRRHAQIQIALYLIGCQLGYRTWVAQNDKGIEYRKKRLCEHDGVIADLRNERLLSAYGEAANAALLIDCIWFKNGRLMPAVLEVEHSTGVKSGLLRMQKFKDLLPPFPSRWVIVASDADRDLVLRECQAPQFAGLAPKYFSYSAVEELYALCMRRKLRGVTEEFLDCFMESTAA